MDVTKNETGTWFTSSKIGGVMMKLCFNEATTLENSTLAKDLELCDQFGYDYIEIRSMDKLKEYLETHTLDDLKEFFRTHHIKPYAFNAIVFFNNRSEEEYTEILAEYKELLEMGSQLGMKKIVVVPLVTEQKITKSEIEKSAVKVLKEFSDLASPFGIEIALEFVGHPQCTINTFEHAYDIIKKVNRDNVGLVFDCFHFYAMNSSIESLKQADCSKISVVHIDDAEDFPVGFLTDEDRLWPGEGVIPIQDYLTILRDKGYDGVVSVELFRPEYYQMSAEEVIYKAKQSTLAVVSSVFENVAN